MNLLHATLAVPLATAAIGALPGPRRPKEAVLVGGLAATFVLALATAGRFLAGETPEAFGGALRVDGLSALVLVLTAFVGLLSGLYSVGYLERNERAGFVSAKKRTELLALVPAYLGGAPARRRVQQPRRPVDRGGGDDARLGVPGRLPEPGHLPRGGLEVPGPRQRGPRVRPARHGAALRLGPGRPRRGDVRPRLDAAPRPRPAASPVHGEARGRVPPHRVRHQGGPRSHAHVEAGCLPRGAVAGRRPDGGGDDERLALRPAAGAPRVEGRPGPGLLGPFAPRPRARLRSRRDAVHPHPVEPQAPARLLEHRARRDHGGGVRSRGGNGRLRGAAPHDVPHVREAGRVLLRGHARPAPPILRLRRDRRGHARKVAGRERAPDPGDPDGDRLPALRPLLQRDDDPEGRLPRSPSGGDRGLPGRSGRALLRLLLSGGPACPGRSSRACPGTARLPARHRRTARSCRRGSISPWGRRFSPPSSPSLRRSTCPDRSWPSIRAALRVVEAGA